MRSSGLLVASPSSPRSRRALSGPKRGRLSNPPQRRLSLTTSTTSSLPTAPAPPSANWLRTPASTAPRSPIPRPPRCPSSQRTDRMGRRHPQGTRRALPDRIVCRRRPPARVPASGSQRATPTRLDLAWSLRTRSVLSTTGRSMWAVMQRGLTALDRISERTICVVDDDQNAGYASVSRRCARRCSERFARCPGPFDGSPCST
jgi:hypothetical protein